MTESEAKSMLYKRNGSKYWYYNIRDKVTGKRIRKSTQETDFDKAIQVLLTDVEEVKRTVKCKDLGSLLLLFSNYKTNPKYQEAQIDGSNYSYRYAYCLARIIDNLINILKKEAPLFLKKDLNDIGVEELKKIKEIIVARLGKKSTATKSFSYLKQILAYAYSMGWTDKNLNNTVNNIKYPKKERPAIDIEIIKKVLELSPSKKLPIEKITFFIVAATTGMRRGEILALSPSQINNGILVINRNLKYSSGPDTYEIGLPKCNKERIIPLPKITQSALSKIEPKNDRFFPYGLIWANLAIADVVAVCAKEFPEYASDFLQITCHVLRHSLNSALTLMGAPQYLLEKYFGWAKNTKSMQTHYMHIYCKHLIPVSNTIDYLFSDKFKGFDDFLGTDDYNTDFYYDRRVQNNAYTGIDSNDITI